MLLDHAPASTTIPMHKLHMCRQRVHRAALLSTCVCRQSAYTS